MIAEPTEWFGALADRPEMSTRNIVEMNKAKWELSSLPVLQGFTISSDWVAR